MSLRNPKMRIALASAAALLALGAAALWPRQPERPGSPWDYAAQLSERGAAPEELLEELQPLLFSDDVDEVDFALKTVAELAVLDAIPLDEAAHVSADAFLAADVGDPLVLGPALCSDSAGGCVLFAREVLPRMAPGPSRGMLLGLMVGLEGTIDEETLAVLLEEWDRCAPTCLDWWSGDGMPGVQTAVALTQGSFERAIRTDQHQEIDRRLALLPEGKVRDEAIDLWDMNVFALDHLGLATPQDIDLDESGLELLAFRRERWESRQKAGVWRTTEAWSGLGSRELGER